MAVTDGGGCNLQGELNDESLTLRQLIAENATVKDIHKFVKAGGHLDKVRLEAFDDVMMYCMYEASRDPVFFMSLDNPKLVKYLLKLGKSLDLETSEKNELGLNLDVHVRNWFGKTALMTAAQYNLHDTAKILLKAGADVNVQTYKDNLEHGSRTALMYAASSGDLKMIKLLLKYGANKEAKDSKGYTAWHYLQGVKVLEFNQLLSVDDYKEAMTLLSVSKI